MAPARTDSSISSGGVDGAGMRYPVPLEGPSGKHIARAVAREHGRPGGQVELGDRLVEELTSRLSAPTRPGHHGIVRTVVGGVDPCAVRVQHLRDAIAYGLVVGDGEHAARDAALIRDHDDGNVVLIEQADRFGSGGTQLHLVRA